MWQSRIDMEIQTGKAKVEVTLEFEGVETGEFTIPVKAVNVPENLEISSQTEEITVKIRGPKDDVKRLRASDLVAQVDCTGITEGVKELTVTITCEKYPKVAVTNGEHKVMLDMKLIPQDPTQPTVAQK